MIEKDGCKNATHGGCLCWRCMYKDDPAGCEDFMEDSDSKPFHIQLIE